MTQDTTVLLDERKKSMRYYEELGDVSWHVGSEGLKPNISYHRAFMQGRILFQKSWGGGYGIRTDKTLGKLYEYKFDVGYVRDPLKKVVFKNGWEFVPVVQRKHATY